MASKFMKGLKAKRKLNVEQKNLEQVEENKDINENVNVAPDYVHSVDEIAKIATKACKKTHLKIRYNNDKELDGQFRKDVDSSKLISLIDGFEFTSLEEGIEKVYDNFS